MTLKNAIDFFESLLSETNKKSEIKVYREFIHILNSLEKRNLSEPEIQSIETELDNLNLNSNRAQRKYYYKKALYKFKKYLKDAFSLTPKGYYTNLGISLGSSFGFLFGIVFLSGLDRSLGIALGLSIGMIIGIIIGRSIDSRVVEDGRVL